MQEVTVKEREPALVIALSGEIDSRNADEFYAEAEELYSAAPRDVIFDCSALAFIDSTTLGTFVKLHKKISAGGHHARLIGLHPRLKKLFVICALDTVMEIA